MMKLIACLAALVGCLDASAMCQPSLTSKINVSDSILCGETRGVSTANKTFWVKLDISVELANNSGSPVLAGKFDIVQEQFYRKSADGKIRSIRTNPSPDEAPGSIRSDIQDAIIEPGSRKVVQFTHYVDLIPSDFQLDSKKRSIIVSFLVANLHSDGDANTFWTNPVRILIPNHCAVGEK